MTGKLALLTSRLRRAAGRLAGLWRQRRVRLAANAAGLLLVFAFLAYAVYRNWNELQQYEWQADVRFLLLAALVYGLCFSTVLLVWHGLMAGLGAVTDWRINARIYCYSSLPKRIPGVVWYIAGRAVMYQEQGVARSLTVLASLFETVLLMVSGLLVYLLSLLVPAFSGAAGVLPPGVALALLVPLLVGLHPAVFGRAARLLLRRVKYEGEVALSASRVAGLLGIGALAWVLGGFDLYLLANAVYPVPLDLLPAVVGAWAAAGVASIIASYLVGGLFLTEVTLVVLLSRFLPLPVSIVVALLFRLLLTVGEVAWALLGMWVLSGFRRPARREVTE